MSSKKQEIIICPSIIWYIFGFLGLTWFVYSIRDVLILLFIAIIIVSALQPIVELLEQRKGVPRMVTAIGIYFTFFAFLTWIFWLIIPILTDELKLLSSRLPIYFENLDNFTRNITEIANNYDYGRSIEGLIKNASEKINNSLSGIFSNTVSFFWGLFSALLVLSMSFYMLVKKDGIRGFFQILFPKKHQAYAIDLLNRIQKKMGLWLLGVMILMIFIFALNYLVLSLLGVPFALVLALFAGAMEIIPYIGPTLGLAPAFLVALTVSPLTALLVLISYVTIQQVENHIIVPVLMKKVIGLNPVFIILALLIGFKLAGTLGVMIAVPFATSLEIVIKDILNKKFFNPNYKKISIAENEKD